MKKNMKTEKKSYLKEFFGLFGKKKPEIKKDINDLIDNDEILKKIDTEITKLNAKAADRLKKIATPEQMSILKKHGVVN